MIFPCGALLSPSSTILKKKEKHLSRDANAQPSIDHSVSLADDRPTFSAPWLFEKGCAESWGNECLYDEPWSRFHQKWCKVPYRHSKTPRSTDILEQNAKFNYLSWSIKGYDDWGLVDYHFTAENWIGSFHARSESPYFYRGFIS